MLKKTYVESIHVSCLVPHFHTSGQPRWRTQCYHTFVFDSPKMVVSSPSFRLLHLHKRRCHHQTSKTTCLLFFFGTKELRRRVEQTFFNKKIDFDNPILVRFDSVTLPGFFVVRTWICPNQPLPNGSVVQLCLAKTIRPEENSVLPGKTRSKSPKSHPRVRNNPSQHSKSPPGSSYFCIPVQGPP